MEPAGARDGITRDAGVEGGIGAFGSEHHESTKWLLLLLTDEFSVSGLVK
jgi:hypothetical protein